MMHRIIAPALLIIILCNASFSAELLHLANHQTNILQSFTPLAHLNNEKVTLKEINRYTDINQITHIRLQEYYEQYPVLNAQAVIHLSLAKTKLKALPDILRTISNKDSMNGNLYKNVNSDLTKISKVALTSKQASRAIRVVIDHFKLKQYRPGDINIKNVTSKTIIWIDDNAQAHWAYKVSFDVTQSAPGKLPAKPTYIIDAHNFLIYKNWDDIKTISQDNFVKGGGWGGNPNAGKLAYDGMPDHLSSFMVKRENNTCYLENSDVIVKHAVTENVMHYPCLDINAQHNQVYWSEDFDKTNEGYSPANDAMFSAQIIKEFYKSWYNVPVLVNPDGSEMMLVMNVHVPKMDNAYWDGESMTFGDGDQLYPLTSLGVAVHEVSHGFTQQHSDLIYEGQSGGMNEAFSDMAAQAAEFYIHKKNTWQIGNDIFKISGEALRYMDQPSKDCYGKTPGTFCSIDNANQYYEGLDVHFSSGVYNRAFYLLSNMPNWNPHKAFAVMLQANASYWVNTTKFTEGAACVVRAADDLHYEKSDVAKVFKAVGIFKLDNCTNHD